MSNAYFVDMATIVECPRCHREELYGNITWHNGEQMCKSCIADVWAQEVHERELRKKEDKS